MALRSFREGDRVKAVVLAVDTEKRRISLGLKPSYFAEGDFDAPSDDESEDEEPVGLGVIEEDEAPLDGDVEMDNDASENDEEDAMVVDEPDVGHDLFASLQTPQSQPATSSSRALELGGGFSWSANQDEHEASASESSEDEDEDAEQVTKKKKHRR